MTNFNDLKNKLVNSKLSKELYELLQDLWDNDHFVFGVLSDAKTDEQKQELINMIKNGCNNTDIITLKAFNYSGAGIPVDETYENPNDIIIEI